jgi:hypothetical protein
MPGFCAHLVTQRDPKLRHWHPTRRGIPCCARCRTARHPARSGISALPRGAPGGAISDAAQYPTRRGIPRGAVTTSESTGWSELAGWKHSSTSAGNAESAAAELHKLETFVPQHESLASLGTRAAKGKGGLRAAM